MHLQPAVAAQDPFHIPAIGSSGSGLAVVQPSFVVALVECWVALQASLVGPRGERWVRPASAWWDMLEPREACAHILAKNTYMDKEPDNSLVEQVRHCLCQTAEPSLDMAELGAHQPAAEQ